MSKQVSKYGSWVDPMAACRAVARCVRAQDCCKRVSMSLRRDSPPPPPATRHVRLYRDTLRSNEAKGESRKWPAATTANRQGLITLRPREPRAVPRNRRYWATPRLVPVRTGPSPVARSHMHCAHAAWRAQWRRLTFVLLARVLDRNTRTAGAGAVDTVRLLVDHLSVAHFAAGPRSQELRCVAARSLRV